MTKMTGKVNVRTRVRNALIGIAYGDSFGMPVEMWNPKTIQEKVGTVTTLLSGHPDNPISRDLCRGSVTDDTMNSLIVTDVLYQNHGRVDAGMFIRELKHWMDTSKSSAAVVGPSTRRAIELIDQGVSMEVSGSRGTTNGGAMKRMNMFLRWMVRKPPVDFGVWDFIPTGELLIPLDVHVARISRQMGLLTRSSNDFKAVIELTDNLKKFNSEDPVRYDFATFGYGVNQK